MIPKNRIRKISYLSLLSVAVLMLAGCVVMTVWAAAVEDGWITVTAIMLMSWLVSAPFILGSVIWTALLLGSRGKSRTDTQIHS